MAALGAFGGPRIPFDPKEISRTLQAEIAKETRDVAVTFVEIVVPKSPVDTGHFRHNWRIRPKPTDEVLKGVDRTGRRTINTARRAAETLTKNKPFKPVFIQNNVIYGSFLNAGSSKQAPAGFVEAAMAVAVRKNIGKRKRI